MILSEKEKMVIQDLMTQEEGCIQKYGKYAQEANDGVLKELFETIQEKEKKHHESLSQVLAGNTVSCDCNDHMGAEYKPKATYDSMTSPQAKKDDGFLVTDCIGTEKLTSSSYNSNVFNFGNSQVRKLLGDIEIEEQNHAEMLYKYKTVNSMC